MSIRNTTPQIQLHSPTASSSASSHYDPLWFNVKHLFNLQDKLITSVSCLGWSTLPIRKHRRHLIQERLTGYWCKFSRFRKGWSWCFVLGCVQCLLSTCLFVHACQSVLGVMWSLENQYTKKVVSSGKVKYEKQKQHDIGKCVCLRVCASLSVCVCPFLPLSIGPTVYSISVSFN